jgi:hypothetical protein
VTRALLRYAALSAAAIALIALALTLLVYTAPLERHSVMISAAVALPIQVLAFGVAWLMARANHGIAGWGVGAIVSLLTLVIYGTVARGAGLHSGAALVSLAAFLFVTELIEPPLLNV